VRCVFDANCWRAYVDEKMVGESGVGASMFESRAAEKKILFDADKLMRQQYISLKKPYSGELFDNWFEGTFFDGGIDIVEIKGKTNIYNELKNLGIPKSEHVYFRVAVHGGATFLVSIDIDFFDPTKKKAGETEKRKLVLSGRGPVCKHMKKGYSVVICCPEVFTTN